MFKFIPKLILIFIAAGIGLVILFKIDPLNLQVFKNSKPTGACPKCNVLLIDIDILRADSLPCYGYQLDTAPNICNLSQSSLLFKNNFAPDHWTLPSAFSTITSLYPNLHLIRTAYADRLSPEIPTLAETYQQQGFKTALVGIDDLAVFLSDSNGGFRGYDLVTEKPIPEVIAEISKTDSRPWFIHYYIGNLHMPYLLPIGIPPIQDLPAPKFLPKTQLEFNMTLNDYLKKHYQNVFQPRAIAEFKEIILAPNQLNDTSVADLFVSLSDIGQGQIPDLYLKGIWDPTYQAYIETFDTANPSDVAYIKMMYDSQIKLIDVELGNLFKQLDLTKTISVIYSDHGEAFGEHGKFGHTADYHSELYETPLIISAPNLKSQIVESPSSNLDIFPTLIDLSGLKKPAGLLGKSLVSPTVNLANNQNQFVMSQVGFDGVILQNQTWLYFLPNQSWGITEPILHNKISDPGEKLNVIKDYPELAAKLFQQASLLASYEVENLTNPSTPIIIPTQIKPEQLEKLKADGYF